jgi:hypothetical protein
MGSRYTIHMQFKVPQFIDIEDKVFGPLTFKQFAYLAGGAGFAYLSVRFFPWFIAIVLAPAFIGFALALAFFKYNDKPFIFTVESFIKYYLRSRLYLWKAQPKKDPTPPTTMPTTPASRGTLSESKLKTLSWSLDVQNPNK